MTKVGLANILNEILLPLGFKKKGDSWLAKGAELTKVINLQKSQFSDTFYVNFGYVLNALPLEDKMHIYNRLTSSDIVEKERIGLLLNLNSSISDNERSNLLKLILEKNLLKKIESINTESDLLEDLKSRAQLNDIPLIVKQHFNLDI